MIGFRLKCWHIEKNCQHYLIMFIRIHLFYLMTIFGLLQSTTGLTGIEFNVDANNIAAVNSQMRKKTNDHPEFSVIINEEAILPCNISAPTKEDSVALILWYRAGGKNAIYTVDARYTSNLEQAKHFSSLALKGRVTLDCGFGNLTKENLISKLPRDKNKKQINNVKKIKGFIDSSIKIQKERQCFLKIKPVQLDDGMVDYRCRVDFKRGRTINYNMFLNLIVPSTKIEIYAQEKNNLTLLNDSSINVLEDDTLNLTCISAGGNPSPSVTWWDEYKLIDESYERVLSPQANKVVNSLLLGPFNKNYMNKKYTCKVSNNNLSQPIEKTISLNVDLKPKNLIIEFKPTTIMAKEKLKLICKCSNGKAPTRLIWLKDENLIDEQLIENKITTDNTFVSILTWIVTPEDNEKKITCRSINTKFKNFTIEDSFMLNIQFAPFVSLVFGSSNRNEELLEGSDIFFECNFQSNPIVKEVKWIFNDQLLIDSKEKSFEKSKKDENFFSSKNFNTYEVKKELNNSYSNQILKEDNFSFLKENKLITNKQNNFIYDKSLGMNFLKLPNISISFRSLLLKSATNIHSGQYQCIAINDIGIGKSDIIPLQFQFAPRCSENQPLEYLLKNSQSTDIGCEVEADPAEVTFHWLLLSGTGELTSQSILNTFHENYQNKQSTVAPYTTFHHHHQNKQSSISNSKLFSNLSSPNINFSFEYTYQNNSASNKNTSNFWQHGQSKTPTSNMPIRIKSLAKYTPTQNNHYGVLQCWASNAVGVQKQPCTFYVLAAQVPEPPINCSTTNITYNTLTLECIPGYSGGLPQNFHLEVYTKQNKNYKNNYETNLNFNETSANKFLSNFSAQNETKNSSTLFIIKKINGQEMILLHNITIEGYPFFSVNKLPPGNSFYLITYASNTRGVSKQVEIVANTLTAQRWQTDVLVNYLEQNAMNSSVLLSIIIFSFTTITVLIIIVIFKNRVTKKVKNDLVESNQNLKETSPSNLCLSLDITNSDFQILSHNQFSSNSENCQDSFHHPILNYSTIHSTYSIPNDCHIKSSQCFNCDNCKNTCNQCNSFLPTCLNTNQGEITLESLEDNVISNRTIPVSIILPQDEAQNQMSLFHQINSPLSCRHLPSNTFENQNNSYFNIPMNHSTENSIDHSSSSNSTEKKNRVFFIQTSDNDKTDFTQTNQGKVKILDLACDKSTIDSNQLNYYKLLNYNSVFDNNIDSTLNSHFKNSDFNYSTHNHFHDQLMSSNELNSLDKNFCKTQELSDNIELLDANIEINQSLNNKSWIVIDQGKEKNQTLTSV